jgi:hypothetical protein
MSVFSLSPSMMYSCQVSKASLVKNDIRHVQVVCDEKMSLH